MLWKVLVKVSREKDIKMMNQKQKEFAKKQNERLKNLGKVNCFVCKDYKSHIHGNKGPEYSEMIA